MATKNFEYYLENAVVRVRTLINLLKYIVCVRKIIKKIVWVFTILFVLLLVSKYPLEPSKNIVSQINQVSESVKNFIKVIDSTDIPKIGIYIFGFYFFVFLYFRPKGDKYFYKNLLNQVLLLWSCFTILFILKNPLNLDYFLFLAIFIAIQDILVNFFEIESSSSNYSSVFTSRMSKARYLSQLINTNKKNLILGYVPFDCGIY